MADILARLTMELKRVTGFPAGSLSATFVAAAG